MSTILKALRRLEEERPATRDRRPPATDPRATDELRARLLAEEAAAQAAPGVTTRAHGLYRHASDDRNDTASRRSTVSTAARRALVVVALLLLLAAGGFVAYSTRQTDRPAPSAPVAVAPAPAALPPSIAIAPAPTTPTASVAVAPAPAALPPFIAVASASAPAAPSVAVAPAPAPSVAPAPVPVAVTPAARTAVEPQRASAPAPPHAPSRALPNPSERVARAGSAGDEAIAVASAETPARRLPAAPSPRPVRGKDVPVAPARSLAAPSPAAPPHAARPQPTRAERAPEAVSAAAEGPNVPRPSAAPSVRAARSADDSIADWASEPTESAASFAAPAGSPVVAPDPIHVGSAASTATASTPSRAEAPGSTASQRRDRDQDAGQTAPLVARLDRRGLPDVTVVRTAWHPTPDRRSAKVRLEASREVLTLREGDAVGGFVLQEISPSAVVFAAGEVEIRRRVGESTGAR